MRALQIHKFGGPDTLKLEDIPVPSVGDSQVLVRVHAAGINPVDTYIREGAYATLPKLPAVLGREIAGRVEDVGEGVSSVKVLERQFVLLKVYWICYYLSWNFIRHPFSAVMYRSSIPSLECCW